MSLVGLGLHILIALIFAVHAVRTGRPIFWVFILFSFPLLGSLVYFIVEYLPGTRLQRGVGTAARSFAHSLDPGRELRQARRAFELSATVQNRLRLANALLAAGDASEAAEHFEACLHGPFANDPEIRLSAARARLENGKPMAALELLIALGQRNPEFRPEQVSVLRAQVLAAAGRPQEARDEFEAALARFDSVEVRAKYAIWAAQAGDLDTAQRMRDELARTEQYWDRHTRSFHQDLFRSVDAALAAGRRAG
jgi:hypothetical protein